MLAVLRQTLLLLANPRLLLLRCLAFLPVVARPSLLPFLVLLVFLIPLRLRAGRNAQSEQRDRTDSSRHDHPIQNIDSHCIPPCTVRNS